MRSPADEDGLGIGVRFGELGTLWILVGGCSELGVDGGVLAEARTSN